VDSWKSLQVAHASVREFLRQSGDRSVPVWHHLNRSQTDELFLLVTDKTWPTIYSSHFTSGRLPEIATNLFVQTFNHCVDHDNT
jgi:hypothetical protein